MLNAEEKDHLPQPPGSALPNAAQDAVGFLCCEDTLLAYVQLTFHQDLKIPLCRAAFQPLGLQHALAELGTALCQTS